MEQELMSAKQMSIGRLRAAAGCQVGSLWRGLVRWGCHSGTRGRTEPAAFLAVLLLALLPRLAAQAQGFELSLRDGRVWLATAIEGDPARELVVQVGGAPRKLAAGELLAIHGCAVQSLEMPSALLAGGEVLSGALVGGDESGDHVELLSPSLGKVVVAVDRLTALLAPSTSRTASLPLPQGVGEAIFQRAAVGYDVLAGSLHQFGDRGVRFQPDGESSPRWFRLQDVVGLRIADSVARAIPAAAWLRTRTGDQLGVVVRRFTAAALQCELETGAKIELRYADLASLAFSGVGTFLSDLEPKEVVESGFDGDTVHPWRRDLCALGSPLVAGDRTHGKGLGVHSRSRLTFVAPAGVAAFWTRVAIDDSVALLPLRPHADVRVLVNDKLRFEHKGLQHGEAPRDTGLLAVVPGDRVTLEVDFGKGRDLGDRIDWLSAVFMPGTGRQ